MPQALPSWGFGSQQACPEWPYHTPSQVSAKPPQVSAGEGLQRPCQSGPAGGPCHGGPSTLQGDGGELWTGRGNLCPGSSWGGSGWCTTSFCCHHPKHTLKSVSSWLGEEVECSWKSFGQTSASSVDPAW